MHELSIAQNIHDIVQQSVRHEELADVRAVKLKVGALSGVVPECLEFSFAAIVAGTLMSRAELQIERIPFVVQCDSCQKSFSNDYGFVVCPTCGRVDTQIVSGTELQIIEIELQDAGVEAP